MQFPIKQWGHEDKSNKKLIYPDFIRKGKAFYGLLYIHIWGGKVNIYDIVTKLFDRKRLHFISALMISWRSWSIIASSFLHIYSHEIILYLEPRGWHSAICRDLSIFWKRSSKFDRPLKRNGKPQIYGRTSFFHSCSLLWTFLKTPAPVRWGTPPINTAF